MLKLDCEGCEEGALRGAFGILQTFPPHYIIIEVLDGSNLGPIFRILQDDLGYSRAFVIGYGDETGTDFQTSLDKITLLGTREVHDDFCSYCDMLFVHDNAINLGFFSS